MVSRRTQYEFAAGAIVIGCLIAAFAFVGTTHGTPQKYTGIGAITTGEVGFAGSPTFTLTSPSSDTVSGRAGENSSTTVSIQLSTSFNLYVSYSADKNGTSTLPPGTHIYSTVNGQTTELPAPPPGSRTGPGTGLTPVSKTTSATANVNIEVTLSIPATAAASNQYHLNLFISSYDTSGLLTYSNAVEVSVQVA